MYTIYHQILYIIVLYFYVTKDVLDVFIPWTRPQSLRGRQPCLAFSDIFQSTFCNNV